MDTLCGEQHRCGRSYPGDFDSEKEDLVSENSACESEEGMVTADPIVTVLPGENTKKQLHQSAHCSRSFIKKDPIEPHLLTQTGGYHIQCDHCGKSFARKYDFMRHMRTHTGKRPYKCQVCPMALPPNATLARRV
ncbi:uncharacterized protein LOC144110628 isoform X2 [Amblyomma americanum]